MYRVKAEIEQLIDKFGGKSYHKGYHYLVRTIEKNLTNDTAAPIIELQKEIAEEFGCTEYTVKRGVEVEVSRMAQGEESKEKLLRAFNGEVPSAKEFIWYITRLLKGKERDENKRERH